MRALLSLLLTAVLAACVGDGSSDASAPAEATVRDSAGIRIVENRNDPLPRWTLAAEPVLSIGALAGTEAETLYQVNDVERLADGSWLISNGGTEEIRVFDASGAYLRTIGRRGEGPGEFVSLSRVFVLEGDSVAAYDSRQRRVTVFDPAGERLRDLRFEELPDGSVTPFGRLTSGEWGVRRSGGSYSTGGTGRGRAERPSEWHALAAPDGGAPALFAELPDQEGWIVQADNFVSFRSIPFAPSNGMEAAGVRFFGGVTENAEIRVWDAAGVEVERWRILEPPRPVTDADWNGVRERERARVEEDMEGLPDGWLDAAEEFWSQVDRPEAWPAWSQVRPSRDGEVWLSDYILRTEEPWRWRVFDASGVLVREVETPGGFELHWIGGGLVAGVEEDEFEVEYVRVYELVPAG